MPKVLSVSLYDRVTDDFVLIDKTIIANRIDLAEGIRVWASNSAVEELHDRMVKLLNEFVQQHSKKPHQTRKLRTIQQTANRIIKILSEEKKDNGYSNSTTVLRRAKISTTRRKHSNRLDLRSKKCQGMGREGRQVRHIPKGRAVRVGSEAQQTIHERGATAWRRRSR